MSYLTDEGAAFIAHHEGFVGHPYVPLDRDGNVMGASGVTLDFGYDLGHQNVKQFTEDWTPALLGADVRRLEPCCGLKGNDAKVIASTSVIKGIRISKASATTVFQMRTLPRYVAITLKAFPESGQIHPAARAALVSLVFNRGGDMSDENLDKPETWRREEMRVLADAVRDRNYPAMAEAIRVQKRLWPHLPGLQKRREAEAVMLEQASRDGGWLPEAA